MRNRHLAPAKKISLCPNKNLLNKSILFPDLKHHIYYIPKQHLLLKYERRIIIISQQRKMASSFLSPEEAQATPVSPHQSRFVTCIHSPMFGKRGTESYPILLCCSQQVGLEGAVHFHFQGQTPWHLRRVILCKTIRGLDKDATGASVSQNTLMCGRTKVRIACGMCDIFLINSKPSFIQSQCWLESYNIIIFK